MKAIKRIILLAAFVVLSLAPWNTVVGQANTMPGGRFDWAVGFGGRDDYQYKSVNKVMGQHVDSEGNLYVCSMYGLSARFADTLQLPYGPWGGMHPNNNMVLFKMAPDGTLLWHKEIYGNEHAGFSGFAPLGDTAFVIGCSFSYTQGNTWMDVFGTHYCDSLPPFDWSGVPFVNGTAFVTLFLTVDTSGQVTDRHAVTTVTLDENGVPYTAARLINNIPDSSLYMLGIGPVAMTADGAGNIVMLRPTALDVTAAWCDTCPDNIHRISPAHGNANGFRIYVDGDSLTTCRYPKRAFNFNAQLMKFSPGFDSLLASRPLVYDTVGVGRSSLNLDFTVYPEAEFLELYLKTDAEDNVYVSGTVLTPTYGQALDTVAVHDTVTGGWQTVVHYDTAYCRDLLFDPVDSSLRVHTAHLQFINGFLVKFSPSFEAQWVNEVRWRDKVNSLYFSCGSQYYPVEFDEADGSLYVGTRFNNGGFHDTARYCNAVCGPGDTLVPHPYKGAGFIHLRAEDGSYIGSGCVESTFGATGLTDLAVKHNRVIFQVEYARDLVCGDSVYQHNYVGQNATLALVVMDNEGHMLKVVDYENNDAGCSTAFTMIHDSILYLSGMMGSTPLHLGDTLLSPHFPLTSYVAKYIDTAFLTPYVHTGDTGSVRITVVGDEGAFVAYPNPFRQRVTIESRETLTETAWLTDIMGRREEVRLTPDGPGQYSLDLTSRPQATYLLTLTTADGKQHTIRLLKQSDIFSR